MNESKPSRFPFTPYPQGIYAVAFSHEVKPLQIKPVTFMGEELVLFRSAAGEIAAIEAYCPHMGANLAFGIVKKDLLQCPFHGIQFKKDGCSIVKDKRGGKIQVKSWPVFEKYGLIFLTHQTANISFPEWNLAGWGKPIEYCFKIKSHPQEIFENTVDQSHFFNVHQYVSIKKISPAKINGAEFEIDYLLERHEGIFGVLDKGKISIKINIHIYGLGFSMVDIFLPKYGLQAKQIVFATPIDGQFIHVRALTSVKTPVKLAFLPKFLQKTITNQLCKLAAKSFLKDFLPDLKIWENKKYMAKPSYLNNDGDFEQYRAWASQFY